jgi:hypothetical protein
MLRAPSILQALPQNGWEANTLSKPALSSPDHSRFFPVKPIQGLSSNQVQADKVCAFILWLEPGA